MKNENKSKGRGEIRREGKSRELELERRMEMRWKEGKGDRMSVQRGSKWRGERLLEGGEKLFYCIFVQGRMTTQTESINPDLQRGLDI